MAHQKDVKPVQLDVLLALKVEGVPLAKMDITKTVLLNARYAQVAAPHV